MPESINWEKFVGESSRGVVYLTNGEAVEGNFKFYRDETTNEPQYVLEVEQRVNMNVSYYHILPFYLIHYIKLFDRPFKAEG